MIERELIPECLQRKLAILSYCNFVMFSGSRCKAALRLRPPSDTQSSDCGGHRCLSLVSETDLGETEQTSKMGFQKVVLISVQCELVIMLNLHTV